jgi:hypothetical protein
LVFFPAAGRTSSSGFGFFSLAAAIIILATFCAAALLALLAFVFYIFHDNKVWITTKKIMPFK